MRLLRDGGRMGRRRRVGVLSAAGLVCLIALSAADGLAAQAPGASAVDVGAMLDQYCVACHNDRLRTAELSLDGVDAAHPEADPELWEKVIARLRAASMPPPRRPRPDPATYSAAGRASRRGHRRGLGCRPPTRPRQCGASDEPHRVRQRRPRPLRARHRRGRSAAGRRDRRRQLRQFRRRPDHLARPSGAVPVGGAAGHPPRGRAAPAGGRVRHLRGAPAHRAGRSAGRGSAAGLARRPLGSLPVPRRRRVRHPGAVAPPVPGLSHGHGVAPAARRPPRRAAAEALHRRRRRPPASPARPATPGPASPGS